MSRKDRERAEKGLLLRDGKLVSVEEARKMKEAKQAVREAAKGPISRLVKKPKERAEEKAEEKPKERAEEKPEEKPKESSFDELRKKLRR